MKVEKNGRKTKLDCFEDIPRKLLDDDPIAFLDALSAKANEAIKKGEESLARTRTRARLAKSQKSLGR